LIGGGTSPSNLKQALGELLPVGDRTLEVVIIGSSARDDLNGLLGALIIYDAEMVLWGVDPEVNQTAGGLYAMLLDKNMPIQPMAPGQVLDLGGGARLEVAWVGERGAVFWLEWENFSALIPTGKVEDRWDEVHGAPDLLLLPEGLGAEDIPIWKVNQWAPSVILLPLDETDLPILGEHEWITLFEGYPVVNPIDHGWVRVSSDGNQLWVDTER
jgi:hypothetical protein